MSKGRSGWENVYRLVRKIPRGSVVTYGQLARLLRLKGGARAAGRAMAACPSGRGIPWHRVVGERGRILIREPYASLQRRLIESEGVHFVGAAVDLSQHAWRISHKNAGFCPQRKLPGSRRAQRL